jgi:signal transduction histidine kinase
MAIHRWITAGSRAWATGLAIVATILFRDLVVAGGADVLDIGPAVNAESLISNVVSQVGLLLIIAIRVSSRVQEKQTLEQLNHTRASVAAEDADLRRRVGDIDQRIAVQIGLTIEPRIREIDRQLADVERGGDLAVPLRTLRSFVDDELLPLSHRLAASITQWVRSARTPETPGGNLPYVRPRTLLLRGCIRPWTMATVIGLLSLPGVVAAVPAPVALLALAVLMGLFGALLSLARRAVGRRALPIVPAFGLSALLTAVAFVITVGVLSSGIRTASVREFVVSGAVGFVLGILGTLAEYLDERFRLSNASIEADLQSLEDSTCRMRQELWVGRRRYGYALHGGLQSALQAAMLQLAGMRQPDAARIAELRVDIGQAFRRATVESHEQQDLSSVCAEIADIWEESCDITWDVPDQVIHILDHSRVTSACTAEVIRETAQNAVRHGQASRVHIAAEVDDARLVLHVSDDGTWKDGGVGLGSRMLDELCSRWVREAVESGTVIRAEMVVSDRA